MARLLMASDRAFGTLKFFEDSAAGRTQAETWRKRLEAAYDFCVLDKSGLSITIVYASYSLSTTAFEQAEGRAADRKFEEWSKSPAAREAYAATSATAKSAKIETANTNAKKRKTIRKEEDAQTAK